MKNKKESKNDLPLLAIDPTVRGCGYVVFEGPRNPIDWGVIHVRFCKNKRILMRLKALINMYQPSVIVIEDSHQSWRCKRVRLLLSAIEKLAKELNISVFKYSRKQVLEVFENFDKHNKYQIAQQVAEWFPELASRLLTSTKPLQALNLPRIQPIIHLLRVRLLTFHLSL